MLEKFVDPGKGKRQRKEGEGKAIPVQAWTGPVGSRTLRFAEFLKTIGT
jgi:hypothetical protein